LDVYGECRDSNISCGAEQKAKRLRTCWYGSLRSNRRCKNRENGIRGNCIEKPLSAKFVYGQSVLKNLTHKNLNHKNQKKLT
jgi:hypothetical protein